MLGITMRIEVSMLQKGFVGKLAPNCTSFLKVVLVAMVVFLCCLFIVTVARSCLCSSYSTFCTCTHQHVSQVLEHDVLRAKN